MMMVMAVLRMRGAREAWKENVDIVEVWYGYVHTVCMYGRMGEWVGLQCISVQL